MMATKNFTQSRQARMGRLDSRLESPAMSSPQQLGFLGARHFGEHLFPVCRSVHEQTLYHFQNHLET